MLLSGSGCPWKDHLLELEDELQSSPLVKYVLFTDKSDSWRLQCVPVSNNSFENRLLFPYIAAVAEEQHQLLGINYISKCSPLFPLFMALCPGLPGEPVTER